MKGAVLTDAHGNLPALEVALDAIRYEGCDAIYHYTFVTHAVPYDDGALRRAFEERNVPEREFIRRSFFGR